MTFRVVQVEKRAQSIEGRQHNTENELRGIRLENGEIRKQLDTATSAIRKLEETVDDLQGRLRRNTLVFKGIPEKMEGASSGWDRVEKMILKILVENLKMNVDSIHIERAQRSPTHLSASEQQQNYPKPRPRPIYVAFSTWKSARAVLSNAKMLKENPLTCEEDGVTNIVSIDIEQMYSPVITTKRSEMLRKRWQLKQQHPEWEVFPAYPAKLSRAIFCKSHPTCDSRVFRISSYFKQLKMKVILEYGRNFSFIKHFVEFLGGRETAVVFQEMKSVPTSYILKAPQSLGVVLQSSSYFCMNLVRN